MSKATLIHVANDLVQAMNKDFYNFIWSSKDKVKRLALINDINNNNNNNNNNVFIHSIQYISNVT